MRSKPAKKHPGMSRNARIPIYGLDAWPFRVVGNRNSQKTVAVVTTPTPTRLIQLFDR
jgi:hypothetical protein